MKDERPQWLIPTVLALLVAAAFWAYFSLCCQPPPATVDTAEPAIRAPEPERIGPLHPLPDIPETPDGSQLRPLPPLDNSDEYFRLELARLYGNALADLLVNSQLIGRIVATVDNLPRAHVSEKIRPVGRLDGVFPVDGQDGSGEYTLNPDNYARYDRLVQLVTAANVNEVADLYRRYYPLFQKAYVNLGYPDGYFNDRLVEVIDHLLETPVVPEPVALVRPNVLYQFADPQLESRSSGQKLLIRMGQLHAAKIKETLRAFRAAVVQE
jgi:hypothetical protein